MNLYTEQSASNNVYILFNIGIYLFCTLLRLRSDVFVLLFSLESRNVVFIYEYVSNLHITFTHGLKLAVINDHQYCCGTHVSEGAIIILTTWP